MKLITVKFSSLFGQNILVRILFSNTFSLCSSLNVRDKILHSYNTNDDDDDDDNNNNYKFLHHLIDLFEKYKYECRLKFKNLPTNNMSDSS
jgi:hypothetical protein